MDGPRIVAGSKRTKAVKLVLGRGMAARLAAPALRVGRRVPQ